MPMIRQPADPPRGGIRCRNRGRCGVGIRVRRTAGRPGRGLRCARPGRLVIFQHGLRLVRPSLAGENVIVALQ